MYPKSWLPQEELILTYTSFLLCKPGSPHELVNKRAKACDSSIERGRWDFLGGRSHHRSGEEPDVTQGLVVYLSMRLNEVRWSG